MFGSAISIFKNENDQRNDIGSTSVGFQLISCGARKQFSGAKAIKQNDKESIGQHLIVRRMVVLMMCIAVHCAASANRAKVSFTLIESAGLLDGQSHQH